DPVEETSTTRLFGVVQAVQDHTSVTFYLALCGIQLPEVAGYEPRVDEETIRRLPAIASQAQLFDADGEARFQTDPSAWVVGATLESPLEDVMPEDDEDPRVVDVDLDGEPGITMMLEDWEIYGAMRLLFQLHGALGEGGVLSGNAEVSMSTAVYGDTVPLINVAKKIKKMQEESNVVGENHVFVMTPFDGAVATCETVFDGAPQPAEHRETNPGETNPGETNPGETTPSDCLTQLAERGVAFEVSSSPMETPPGHPNLACEVNEAVVLDANIGGVAFHYWSLDNAPGTIYASCDLALAIHDMAMFLSAEGVTNVVHYGAYNCRVISGTTTISQHGLARAVDIAAVLFDNGDYWTVIDDWETAMESPWTSGGEWLRWFAEEMHYRHIFNVILTPEYDPDHYDHLHFDLTPGQHQLD
ncbi:MAG: extensin family protein, partial [Myxococcota bacterium]|nr:extensin family protein [Myxococcota bacterium]